MDVKIYRIRLVSATRDKWVTVNAINEKAARCMVYTGRVWGIGEVVEKTKKEQA